MFGRKKKVKQSDIDAEVLSIETYVRMCFDAGGMSVSRYASIIKMVEKESTPEARRYLAILDDAIESGTCVVLGSAGPRDRRSS